MKEKILSAIKAKIGKTDISDKTLNAYVDVIVAQITDESQIETAIAPSVVALKEIQANINSVAANAAKAKEAEIKLTEDQKKAAEEAAKKVAENGGEETPPWAKAILESNKVLTDRLSAIEGEKTTISRKQILESKLSDTPIPYKEKILKDFVRMNFKDDEEFNSYVSETESDASTARQIFANEGHSNATPPEQGVAAQKNDVSSIVSMIETGTKEIVESQIKK